MNAWDGILGIFGKLSFFNKFLTYIYKYWSLKTKQFFSWPNIKAKKLIVPERIGNISPKQIANEAILLIKNNKKLETIKMNLLMQRGKSGAVKKLCHIIFKSLKELI